MTTSGSARISPTAHYTGYVWFRNGLSHPAFRTREGWLLYRATQPFNALYGLRGGPSLEAMLLARHRVIDHFLERAIEAGEVGQVIEVAAGLSPRGYRFSRRFADRGLLYVEGDLPGMTERKRGVLSQVGHQHGHHHVIEIDALADEGDASLASVTSKLLDPSVGTAIVTEGLLSYFPCELVRDMWRRFANVLGKFPHGHYLTDLHLAGETRGVLGSRIFSRLLTVFARGRVHWHFDDRAEAEREFAEAGFSTAEVHQAGDFANVLDIADRHRSALVRVAHATIS